MKKFNLAASVIVGLIATNAFAGGAAPFYLGATVGQSSTDDIGDGSTTGHIYGGIQLSDSIAIEAGYTDLGSTAEYYYSDSAGVQQETSGYTVAGVMRHRLGKSSPMHVYGKAGLFRWTTEAEGYAGSAEASGTSPMAGVGVEYELSHNISLKAGWDRYFEVGDDSTLLGVDPHSITKNANNSGTHHVNTLATDVDVYSAGVNFSFY